MERIIAWLYRRYCHVKLDTLYLNGLQRDFTKGIDEQEQRRRNAACVQFVDSLACDLIFNEILKEYTESLFSMGETSEVRDMLHNNINVVLKVEQKIRGYARPEDKPEVIDQYEPL